MGTDHRDEAAGAKATEAPIAVPEAQYLKRLVTAMAVVMCGGMIALVALLWIRLGAAPALPVLPDAVELPAGAVAEAVTFARDWIVVVTEAGEILLYDANGELRDRLRP